MTDKEREEFGINKSHTPDEVSKLESMRLFIKWFESEHDCIPDPYGHNEYEAGCWSAWLPQQKHIAELDRTVAMQVKALEFEQNRAAELEASLAEFHAGSWIKADDVYALAKKMNDAIGGDAKQPMLCDVAAYVINEWPKLQQTNRGLVESLIAIANGEARNIATGAQCEHGKYGYEECEYCISDFAKKAIANFGTPKPDSRDERITGLVEALKQAESWLEGWGSAERELKFIRKAIAKQEGKL